MISHNNTVKLKGSLRGKRRGARLVSSADPKKTMLVTIAVKRRADAPQLDGYNNWDLRSNKLISREEFATQYGASQSDLDLVSDFARSKGMKVIEADAAKRTVKVAGTVQQMNDAFGVNIGRYKTLTQAYDGREGTISLPKNVADVVEGIFGLDQRRMATRASVGGVVALTPQQVIKLYNFPTDPASNISNQTIGLLEFGGGYNEDDIQTFLDKLQLPSASITAVGIDGMTNNFNGDHSTDQGKYSGEITLDIEVAAAVAPGARIAVYFAPFTEQGWIDGLSTAIHDSINSPSVLSISWGWPELQENGQGLDWSPDALNKVSTTFQEAAHLNMTVFAATGDDGSGAQVNDGRAHVNYPASDPWVVACGGTTIENVSGSSFNEQTWTLTGGGISDFFPIPVWQDGIGVPRSVNPDNRQGRGIPDIAANADPHSGYYLVFNGKQTAHSIAGTSAAPPLYAGLVAMLNAKLGREIGYLNPTLYKLGKTNVFRDINDNARNASEGAPGYNSGPGWDACTGWGSINGSELFKALQRVINVQ